MADQMNPQTIQIPALDERRVWFTIPETLNLTPLPPSPSTSRFLVLPTEIHLLIFNNHLTHPVDKICLALTCKRLLNTASSCRLSRVAHHYGYHFSTRHEINDLLRRVSPLDSRGRPMRAWGVCYACQYHRPTRRVYWERVLRQWEKQRGGGGGRLESLGVTVAKWWEVVGEWQGRGSRQCPGCWLQAGGEEDVDMDSAYGGNQRQRRPKASRGRAKRVAKARKMGKGREGEGR
ncbi:hypothetical protein FQN51_007276 [Onygenales sp. PD_10]|nr:hypothetical protein FQN51_007276 [Onygenales sp. PD_10]